ncbi:Putative serine/threonine phosphatase 2C [Candidatus Terasakiella magnetica]|uniref:Serine/threonine phosphatase 2C n=1 Tax=Candidatus Terasakiella magnetica TaxID=1867952 RepID=A0A1C3RHC9_9PROT|nr:hypothetical protein [Candidatus Terasakiella magnetica]SCA56604.1 Putative serine/threonine phosphatase 2C [Candidatus Terasakiella magnetica]
MSSQESTCCAAHVIEDENDVALVLVKTLKVKGQTTAKPKNDVINASVQAVVRQNEDRFRLKRAGDHILAAVADGAGSSGMYCGAWAEKLVTKLPDTPIKTYDDLNGWIDGFWEEFSTHSKSLCANNPGQHNKLVKEGSFSTLVSCWLKKDGEDVVLDCLNYGDSTLYLFEIEGEDIHLSGCLPGSLASQEADPFLLNWKDLPKAEQVQSASYKSDKEAMVVLASDGMGLYILLRYLAFLAGQNKPNLSDDETKLLAEYRQLVQSGSTPVANYARAHAQEVVGNFKDELERLFTSLDTEEGYQKMVGERYEEGLLPNDDSTLAMIAFKAEEENGGGQ